MDQVASHQLITRLREGFERIAFVLRADLWAAAGEAGLNPAQAQVLGLLASRPGGLRPNEIAAHLAISPASVSDTLTALVRKGMAHRAPDPRDARAAILRATAEGLRVGMQIAQAGSHLARALAALSPARQEELLATQIALIRQLQDAGAIPAQRMCPTCRHFQPHVYASGERPHHCGFVNAPIGGRDLRLDCGDHEAADPDTQAVAWEAFAPVAIPPRPTPA